MLKFLAPHAEQGLPRAFDGVLKSLKPAID